MNRWVLITDLNQGRSVQSQMCVGRDFQREGAATEKSQSSPVQCLVSEVGGGQVMDDFEGEEARGGFGGQV